MAWTSPMTFTVGSILTAAQLNANLSANLNYLRSNATNTVLTQESTTSTSWADLTTVGPAVTVTTDVQAIVMIYGNLQNTGNNQTLMGFAVSGASTIAGQDNYSIGLAIPIANQGWQFGASFLITGLTAGSNTFTAKYRVVAGTGSYLVRRITVIPS